MKIDSDGLLESMLLAFVVAALLAFNKFLLISFAGVGSRFFGLMAFLLIMSLVLMLWTMSLYKLKIIEEVKLLDPMIFAVFASLFGFVLFLPAVYYLEGWWIVHTIGTVVVVSLILAKIMVGLIAGKTLHLFEGNKKQGKIPLAG